MCLLLCACQTAKSPQQLLDEQVIDDTHDAFLVDTGGEFGTLLITVESEEFEPPEHGLLLHFSVWNPARMDTPIQTFTKDSDCFGWQEVMDANFDGYMDFSYLFYLGNQPSYCHYWLWDEEQAQFIYCAPLAEISQAEFDAERKVVTGWARSSGAGDGVTTFHRWENGEPVCVRRITSYCSWEESATVLVEDRINGRLQQVYLEEFPWSTGEIEGREAWRQAQYIWSDLDYHGEP